MKSCVILVVLLKFVSGEDLGSFSKIAQAATLDLNKILVITLFGCLGLVLVLFL